LFVLPTLFVRFASFDVREQTVRHLRKLRIVR
jgi:hypothetical protein